jgi:hypothetical protein
MVFAELVLIWSNAMHRSRRHHRQTAVSIAVDNDNASANGTHDDNINITSAAADNEISTATFVVFVVVFATNNDTYNENNNDNSSVYHDAQIHNEIDNTNNRLADLVADDDDNENRVKIDVASVL